MAAYSVNPAPQGGKGVFGAVPGSIALPNPYQSVGGVYPNLQASQNAGSSGVLSELEGQLSPETLASIQNQDAAWGVASGMGPGSGVQHNKELFDAAGAASGLQGAGVNNFNRFSGTSSQTLTDSPQLESQTAMTNAYFAAAPNPTLAGLTNIMAEIGGMGMGYTIGNSGWSGSGAGGSGAINDDALTGEFGGVGTSGETDLATGAPDVSGIV